VRMFLNGTAMAGQPDHHRLLGAPFLGAVRTAPAYRFFAVRDQFPGLVPADDGPAGGGAAIAGELYELDETAWATSLGPGEPPELELGTVELEDGSTANAMLLRPERVADPGQLVDITAFGGWRAYQAHLAGEATAPP
jgi:gamma-glutamylcyclotransferase (GGCT)/AIG2-like uncharacterized protein YtfP